MFLEETDEETDDQDGDEKSDDTAQAKHRSIVLAQYIGMLLVHIPQTLDRSRQHGRYSQEEGKLGRSLAGQFLAHAPDNGRPTPAEARQQNGQYLETADPECNPIGHLPFVFYRRPRKPPVDKQEQDTTPDHDRSNKIQVVQIFVDLLFQQHAKNNRGDQRDDQLDIESEAGKIEEFLIINHHYRQDGEQLDHNLEQVRERRIRDPDDRVGEFHVRRRGNR